MLRTRESDASGNSLMGNGDLQVGQDAEWASALASM